MIQKKELIQFVVQNRTDCGFDVPIFEFNVFSVNSTTKYSWDVTTADISCGYGTLVVNGSTYNLTFTPTLSGLLISLNALGFGFFCSETIGGSTFIYSYDDTNVYGDLDLCAVPATTTTTTTTTTTVAPTTTTTTTTSSTTTTTTASLQYLTDQYSCGTCTLLANNVVVQSNFSLDIGDYFIAEDGNVYQILGSTTGVPVTNISDNTAYIDCASVPCPATTTTTTSTSTTTTTLAPTTTSTTTTTTTLAPTTTSTTTTTTTLAPTTTSTTTTTTTLAPTTTSTTTTTTTILASNIFLDMSLSVDTTVSQITVQGNPVSYVSGATLPNTGGSNSNLNTTDVGGSQNLVITYSCSFSGHKITLTDSIGNITCQNTGVGSNITMTFLTTNISNLSVVNILVEDGTC